MSVCSVAVRDQIYSIKIEMMVESAGKVKAGEIDCASAPSSR